MPEIQSLTAASDGALIDHARTLFQAYAAFLREIAACHSLELARLEKETLDLPHPYTGRSGELLLATPDGATAPVGCVAFRALNCPVDSPGQPAETCELKRLFVLPPWRGRGIAEHLVLAALDHARSHGYRAAILDTQPSSMVAAHALYLKLGFNVYQPAQSGGPSSVIYLRKGLV